MPTWFFLLTWIVALHACGVNAAHFIEKIKQHNTPGAALSLLFALASVVVSLAVMVLYVKGGA